MKHLKGFTVLEALISLMLMSIIITITYSLFNLIGKQLSLFEEENATVLEYNLFNSTLISDIEKANDFSFSENELFLNYYNETEINYFIKSQYILRQSSVKIDTFKLQVINHAFLNDDTKNNINHTFLVSLNVLNDTIKANYYLKKDQSKIINNIYFNED